MPAVGYGVFEGPNVAPQIPPFRKQFASCTVSPHGARITRESFLNVFARLAQAAGAWSSSGPPDWYVAWFVPGAPQASDSSAYMPCLCRIFT